MGAKYDSQKKYTVYAHISPDGRAYVGMTSQPLHKRWGLHGGGYRHQHFYDDIQEIGWNNFNHVIIAENLDVHEAALTEKEYIKKYNSFKNGFNSSVGGENIIPYHKSESTRKKISLNRRGKCCGKDNAMYGKPIRERFVSEEAYKEWADNVRASREKAASKTRKRVICINTGEIFQSLEMAVTSFKLSSHSVLSQVLKKDMYCTTSFDEQGRYLQFDYYDENKEYSLKEYIIKRSKNPIICFPSMDIYCTVNEASRCLHISKDSIRGICKRTCNPKGIDFMYYSEFIRTGYMPKVKIGRRVICIDTKEIYTSTSEAARKTNSSNSQIWKCCEGKISGVNSKDGNTYLWQYYDEYLESPKDVSDKHVRLVRRRVICLTTNKVFETSADADKFYDLARGSANDCCRGARKYSTCKKSGEKLQFAFL